MIALLATSVITLFATSTAAEEWEYGSGLKSELTFLHEFVNYEFDPDREHDWERGLMSASGLRFSYGSTSKHRLFQRHDILLNTGLGGGWRFMTHVRRYGTDHRSDDESSADLGFQKAVVSNISLCVYSDLYHAKDQIDGSIGVLATSVDRENYAQVLFVWDDLIWDARNCDGGDSDRLPLGLSWLARYTLGRWEAFTSGKLSAGFKRRYDDTHLSPDLRYQERRINDASVKLIRRTGDSSRWEAVISHYRFRDGRRYGDPGRNYDYRNEVTHGILRCLLPWRETYRVRLEAHGVGQVRRSDGFRRFRYERSEVMPAVFVTRSFGRNGVELGYFGAVYGWDYDDWDDAQDFSRDDYIDKMKIGWSYAFNKRSWVQMSLSHVVSLSNFGGGNMQYVVMF